MSNTDPQHPKHKGLKASQVRQLPSEAQQRTIRLPRSDYRFLVPKDKYFNKILILKNTKNTKILKVCQKSMMVVTRGFKSITVAHSWLFRVLYHNVYKYFKFSM